jgi:hypothetical protein
MVKIALLNRITGELATMADSFDAYHAWLGIPRAESASGGPHHYRLLGLLLYESNPVVIGNAATRATAQVEPHKAGPQAVHAY